FAALVLTIWVPGHLLIDMAVAGKPNQADSLTALQLGNLVEIVFGPIYSAGIITALAARMEGEKTSYVEAMRAGLHHWGRLFGARIVAGLLVGLGIVALIVPGHVLAADACDCLISVFAVFFSCLLFLYYWEARQQEANAESEIQQEEEIDA